jgi:hypothetical protein
VDSVYSVLPYQIRNSCGSVTLKKSNKGWIFWFASEQPQFGQLHRKHVLEDIYIGWNTFVAAEAKVGFFKLRVTTSGWLCSAVLLVGKQKLLPDQEFVWQRHT